MKKLIFATCNPNKLREISKILGNDFDISTPSDHGIFEEIPETMPTIEGNALQKARYIFERTGLDCFADDTGLEIETLNGEPGVRSARYAGEDKSSEDNMTLVLEKLKSADNRRARFITVIALILGGREYLFEGVIGGVMTRDKRGSEGFGYDPIFIPDGFERTFAEMTLEEKNPISHRGRATASLAEFLKNH